MAAALPTRVGRFDIEEEIARGGFGIVYRGRDSESNEVVAIKVVHPDLADDDVSIQRFDREIRLVSLLQHQNIVKINDVGTLEDGRPYFAMEMLEGETLKQHIARRGRVSIERAVEILRPLADALEVTHSKGVVHRDIKPSNVFLADRVVLLDFGIAKLTEQMGRKITSSKLVVGTPQTMAPEQLLGSIVGASVDVYALGALAYFLLTGSLPFSGENPAAIEELKLNAPPPRPSTLVPLPLAIDDAIASALALDPDERPSSPSVFVNLLEESLVRDNPDIATVVCVMVSRDGSSDDALDAQDDELARLVSELRATGCHLLLEIDASAVLSSGDNADVVAARIEAILASCPYPDARSAYLARGSVARLSNLSWIPDHHDDGVFRIDVETGTKSAWKED